MTEQEFEVVEAMETYGGNFVKALAECFHRADNFNFIKLQNAFPEYWKQYEEMAKK
jgi:hypothetical protein